MNSNLINKIIMTNKSTLQKAPILYHNLSYRPRDQQGRIFVDRDHPCFLWIINYLRNFPSDPLFPVGMPKKIELLKELEHYGMTDVINFLQEKLNVPITYNLTVQPQLTIKNNPPDRIGYYFISDKKWSWAETGFNFGDVCNTLIGFKFEDGCVSFYFVNDDPNSTCIGPIDCFKNLTLKYTDKAALVELRATLPAHCFSLDMTISWNESAELTAYCIDYHLSRQNTFKLHYMHLNT